MGMSAELSLEKVAAQRPDMKSVKKFGNHWLFSSEISHYSAASLVQFKKTGAYFWRLRIH
jgi:hypothetical protein